MLIPLLITYFSVVFNYMPASDSLENHKKPIAADTSDSARLNRLVDLAKKYSSNKATSQEATKYIGEAYQLASEKALPIPYKLHWANAEILYLKQDYEKAQKEMTMTCKLLEATNNFQELAEATNQLAWYTGYIGNFSAAIELFQKNIQFAEEKKLKSVIPYAYRGIADFYSTLNKTEDYKRYMQLFLVQSLQEKDDEASAQAYARLASISLSIDSNFLQAVRYNQQSLAIRKQQNDSIRIASLLGLIGWDYYMAKQNDSSLTYFFRSLDYAMPINYFTVIANSYGNIGTIYRDEKEYKKALYYYSKSIDFSYKVHDWYNLSWLNEDMSIMYKSTGDYKNAYEHYVLYKNFSDSLKNQKFDMGIAQARAKYEADTKARDLELLSLKYIQQKYLVYGFAGLVALALVIGILIIRQSRINARRKISEMNHKISEMTQANLRQQMNPHFIFNTLNSIQYYMYQHDKIATNNYLTKFSSLIRKTLENSQHTAIPIKDELDALQLYLELETLRFKDKFGYAIHVDEDIDTLVYKIPTMLIQPYVENAIGHGLMNKEGNGFLKIDLNLFRDYILCTIEDDGIGRDAAMEIRKNRNGKHNSLGTKITESRLTLANTLYGTSMKVAYTDLNDKEGKPAGTRVEIHLPIMT
jgi:tetratricopeptide (TPR) repeat protein